jgi:hypothetical protein
VSNATAPIKRIMALLRSLMGLFLRNFCCFINSA